LLLSFYRCGAGGPTSRKRTLYALLPKPLLPFFFLSFFLPSSPVNNGADGRGNPCFCCKWKHFAVPLYTPPFFPLSLCVRWSCFFLFTFQTAADLFKYGLVFFLPLFKIWKPRPSGIRRLGLFSFPSPLFQNFEVMAAAGARVSSLLISAPTRSTRCFTGPVFFFFLCLAAKPGK